MTACCQIVFSNRCDRRCGKGLKKFSRKSGMGCPLPRKRERLSIESFIFSVQMKYREYPSFPGECRLRVTTLELLQATQFMQAILQARKQIRKSNQI